MTSPDAVAAEPGPSLDELVARFRRPALALARRIVGDDGLAEDVLQEVFLACWRAAAFDPARGHLSSWVLAMVHHKAVDVVRKEESQRTRLLRAVAEHDRQPLVDAAELACDRAAGGAVLDALRRLPSAQREALVLAYWGGWTQREIAGLTGAPLGTVKTRMLAGMRRLRQELPVGAVPAPRPGDGAAT